VYHKTGEPRRHKPKQKHPIKIFVWGGISTRGATDVVTFSGTMDAELYTKILSVVLLPFMSKYPHVNFRFQQDKDPKHTSRKAMEFFYKALVAYTCRKSRSESDRTSLESSKTVFDIHCKATQQTRAY
jgi:hypothetical protein